jgi:hypothetical protein
MDFGTSNGRMRRQRSSTDKNVHHGNLIQKYNVNLVVFMELNFNWTKVNSSANLVSWLQQEDRET